MPTDVVMPQMGESIFEGTITKWLKKAGERVQKDEPLFEISTDKVDAEIPSPVSGTVSEILIGEGATVTVNTVVAVIADGVSESAQPAITQTDAEGGSEEAAKPSADSHQPSAKAEAAREAPEEQPSGATEVLMPQMGESIFEGTIVKWLKKAGETVQKDEPIFEISTDKVDAEIPSPVSGVLREIRIGEGETVTVNTVVAIIGGAGAVAQGDGSPTSGAVARSDATNQARAAAAPSPASMPSAAEPATPEPEINAEDVRSSPLVRRMAREHNLDLRRISGSGSNGRITKEDVLQYLAGRGEGAQGEAPMPDWASAAAQAGAASKAGAGQGAPPPAMEDKLEPMSRMRSIIAERMLESRRTIPHAYVVYKVDMTRVVRLRERARGGFEQRHGVKLTYMPFIAAAAIEALRRFPVLNASIEGNGIRYHGNIHLGVAVALEWGLIVPVVREAEKRGFADLGKAMADLAERARGKKLKPEEASGSTFTLTNPGVFGGEFGTPIINAPESAILAIGGMKKEPVVLTDGEGNDTIAIRSMTQFCLGFDHRIVDGADAGRFMTAFKDALEGWRAEVV